MNPLALEKNLLNWFSPRSRWICFQSIFLRLQCLKECPERIYDPNFGSRNRDLGRRQYFSKLNTLDSSLVVVVAVMEKLKFTFFAPWNNDVSALWVRGLQWVKIDVHSTTNKIQENGQINLRAKYPLNCFTWLPCQTKMDLILTKLMMKNSSLYPVS